MSRRRRGHRERKATTTNPEQRISSVLHFHFHTLQSLEHISAFQAVDDDGLIWAQELSAVVDNAVRTDEKEKKK